MTQGIETGKKPKKKIRDRCIYSNFGLIQFHASLPFPK